MKMPMHVPPLTKPKPWVLPTTLVCLALGALIAFMMNSTGATEQDPSSMRPEQLAIMYSQSVKDNKDLQKEVFDLRKRLDDNINAMTGNEKITEALQTQLDELRIRAGSTAVAGVGIVITVDDSAVLKTSPVDVNANALMTHDMDLMLLVNELRSAGAEAIAINDQRVSGSSGIRCVGPVIQVNNRPVAAPFIVRAIGASDTLAGAVNLPYGVLDQLRSLGISVKVDKRENILVPAMVVMPPLTVGKPINTGKPPTGQQPR